MKRIFQYSISGEAPPISVEAFLRAKGYSHRILTYIKGREDGISVNGFRTYTSYLLKPGDLLMVTLEEEESSQKIAPVFLPLDILYEDEDILVINKRADTPIHPSIHNHYNTLANAVAFHYQSQGKSFIYRCVNRLDRDTTGLLIIAKHVLSAAILSKMIQRREIHREYLAITDGILPESGTVQAPIARKEGSALERCVNFEQGEEAVTHYRPLLCKNGYSLVSICLETGRTHQIRVHMKYIGFPLIGDFLYHPDYRMMSRQALHSHRLEFLHPITGAQMVLEAPLPQDMQWILSGEPSPGQTKTDLPEFLEPHPHADIG